MLYKRIYINFLKYSSTIYKGKLAEEGEEPSHEAEVHAEDKSAERQREGQRHRLQDGVSESDKDHETDR